MESAQRLGICLQKLSDLLDEAANTDGLTPLNLPAERALLERLREQQHRPLRVAIIGEFNTGKSTFINAILGQDLLPARFLPTTRQLMCICHGEGLGHVSVAVSTDLAETHSADNADDAFTVPAPEGTPTEANASLPRRGLGADLLRDRRALFYL